MTVKREKQKTFARDRRRAIYVAVGPGNGRIVCHIQGQQKCKLIDNIVVYQTHLQYPAPISCKRATHMLGEA